MIPGGSEHNAGLAMDICSLSESFEDTDEAAWLRENAADFRFVGVEAAKDITAKGVTLDGYLNAN